MNFFLLFIFLTLAIEKIGEDFLIFILFTEVEKRKKVKEKDRNAKDIFHLNLNVKVSKNNKNSKYMA